MPVTWCSEGCSIEWKSSHQLSVSWFEWLPVHSANFVWLIQLMFLIWICWCLCRIFLSAMSRDKGCHAIHSTLILAVGCIWVVVRGILYGYRKTIWWQSSVLSISLRQELFGSQDWEQYVSIGITYPVKALILTFGEQLLDRFLLRLKSAFRACLFVVDSCYAKLDFSLLPNLGLSESREEQCSRCWVCHSFAHWVRGCHIYSHLVAFRSSSTSSQLWQCFRWVLVGFSQQL